MNSADFSLFLHPFQIPRMWISMWFYLCEASIVAFLCFQIGKGKYRSQCRPQKILGKTRGWGFGSWGKKPVVCLFRFGGRVRFRVWMCMCSQVEHWQKWRIRSYVCISWSFRDFLLSTCMYLGIVWRTPGSCSIPSWYTMCKTEHFFWVRKHLLESWESKGTPSPPPPKAFKGE